MGKRDKYVDHVLVRYTLADFLKDACEFLRRFFSPKNPVHYIRTAITGFREYLVFFIALLIVQGLFWCSAIYTDSRIGTLKRDAEVRNEYTLRIDGISDQHWTELYNGYFYVHDNLEENDRLYSSYSANKYYDGSYSAMIQLDVVLKDETLNSCEMFLDEFDSTYSRSHVYFGTVVTAEITASAYSAQGTTVIILLGLLSVLILLVLFLIRINHCKFKYGIYMSFGADFGKLFEITAWELFSVGIFTLIPSALLSAGLSAILINRHDGEFCFRPVRIAELVLWLFAVILIAVVPSVIVLSKKMPTELLLAADNSNLVSSPRRSFHIFGSSFPLQYELYSLWRFRKYYAGLLASAVIFSSFFLCGIFISDLETTRTETPAPQFTVSIPSGDAGIVPGSLAEGSVGSSDGIYEADIDEIRKLEGVDHVLWEESVYATEILSHVVMTREMSNGISGKRLAAKQRGMYADNNFKYLDLSSSLYEQITEKGLWNIEGDLSSVYRDDDFYIAITREINNQNVLDVKPGDKIRLAVFDSWGNHIKFLKYDNKYILRQTLENDNVYFRYVDATVGAVIDTGDDDSAYSIILSPANFVEITGNFRPFYEFSVFLDDGLERDRINDVFESVRRIMSSYQGYVIENSENAFISENNKKVDPGSFIILCAVLCLCVAPLVWLYSQAMFGKKRQTENYMLSAFGVRDADIGKMYLTSGGFLTLLGFISSAIFGALINYALYYVINVLMTSLGFGEGVDFVYKLSLPALAICVLISAVSALTATYLPFRNYCRERDRGIKISSDGRN